VGGQFLHAHPVLVVVVLELVAEGAVVVDESGDFGLPLLAAALEAVAGLLDLVLLLLDLVVEAFDLGLVEVLEFVLVLLVGADEVVLAVLVLGLDEVDLVRLLLLQLLQLVAAVGRLRRDCTTSAFSSSFFSRICRFRFSISKFFSSIVSFSLRMFSSWISLLPFWDLRRFWIWAMDSLSYWFLRR
jgi:hypothetical protein